MTDKELFLQWFGVNYPNLLKDSKDGATLAKILYQIAYESWQASVNREGFVLVPLAKETAVAIEQKVEQQLEASGITAEPHRLDGWAILDAISAVEVQDNV